MITGVSVNVSGLRRQGVVTARSVTGSAAIAATRTMNAIRPKLQRHLEERLDRPTRFTLNAFQTVPARLGDRRPDAQIRLRDFRGGRHYLTTLDRGITRTSKGLEQALRRAGRLGSDEYLVQGDEGTGVPIDRFGNVPRRALQIILSDLKAQQDRSANSTRDSRARRRRRSSRSVRGTFFVVQSRFYAPDAALPPGIYLKQPDGELDLWFHIVNAPPGYRDILDMPETARREAVEQYPREFRRAFAEGVARNVAGRLGLTTRRPRPR